jgi:predicted metal-dependent phosphoesterase TrpH
MRIDLHTHTMPASVCSEIEHQEYVERCVALRLKTVALTNHGDIGDNLVLAKPLAERGILLLHGVEISTLFGDFLVYSPDLDYLATLRPVQDPLRRPQIPAHAAVVWAHPAAGGGMSRSSYYPGLEHAVAPHIDAVEVFNGNWLEARYIDEAARIAIELGLPGTGGSDAHRTTAIMNCATEVGSGGAPLRSTADLVAAIREGSVSPWLAHPPANGRRRT